MDLISNQVFLEKCSDYSEYSLADCCNRILTSCVSNTNLRSALILLKPNLITARMGTLACTDGKFILAVAQWFLDHGAYVSLGDSPAFGTSTSVLGKIGIADSLRKLSVKITDFKQVRTVTLPSGTSAGIAVDALDCDMLVNIPRVKAHAQLRVTLGVKNLFGCMVGMRKPLWHMVHGGKCGGFTHHLAELLFVLPAGFTIVDGITAMHRTGPIGGHPFPLGIIACSSNPVAVDSALLSVLRLEPVMSPLMQACIRMHLNGTNLDSLTFPLCAPEDLAVDSFEVPESLNSIRFNPFNFLRGIARRVLLKFGLSS